MVNWNLEYDLLLYRAALLCRLVRKYFFSNQTLILYLYRALRFATEIHHKRGLNVNTFTLVLAASRLIL